MKKALILLWAVSTSLVIAGGNCYPGLSEVIGIEARSCENNGVYLEKHTNLMWQDEAYGDIEDGANARNRSGKKAGSWNYAENYCRRSNYGGYADWRLPTSRELMHVHRKRGQSFVNFRGDDFWSSTPATDTRYYVVYAADAYPYKRYKKESNYIRCVRCYK